MRRRNLQHSVVLRFVYNNSNYPVNGENEVFTCIYVMSSDIRGATHKLGEFDHKKKVPYHNS